MNERFLRGIRSIASRRALRGAASALCFGLPLLVAAQCVDASAREIWRKDGLSASVPDSFACGPRLSLTITAPDYSVFEEQVATIQSVLGNSLATLSFECSAIERVDLSGRVAGTDVFSAVAERSKAWALDVKVSRLESDALELSSRIRSIEDLGTLRQMEERYEAIPGIRDSFAYFIFSQQAEAVVASIFGDEAFSNFGKRIEDFAAEETPIADIREKLQPLVATIADYDPGEGQRYQRYLDTRLSGLTGEYWAAFKTSFLDSADLFDEPFVQIDEQVRKVPLDEDGIGGLDQWLAAWATEEISVYDSLLGSTYAADVAERLAMAGSIRAPGIPAYLARTSDVLRSTGERWATEARSDLARLTATARDVIASSGQSYVELVDVIETGTAIADEFSQAGFEDEARQIVAASLARADQLIADGLDDLKSEMANARMTRDAIATFSRRAESHAPLTADFPRFAEYVVAVEEGIAAGRERECRIQARAAVGSVEHLETSIATPGGGSTLSDMACALYRNGHVLTGFTPGNLLSDAAMTIDHATNGAETITLRKTAEGSAYAGTRVGSVSLTEAEWIAFIKERTIPPPSGVPNARGITECDVLASDPHDGQKVTSGVVLAEVGDDYDFERAIDACIAAVDHNPAEPRYRFQLARVLVAVGAAEEAADLLDALTQARHGPSLHLAAEMRMADDGEDAFYDAIDLLKASAATRYQPAIDLLAELVPPGTEFFRPLPPPSDEQILSTVGGSECTPKIFGMQTCIYRDSVHTKNCFQTGEKTFSCELRFNLSCRATSENSFMNQGPQFGIYNNLLQSNCAANPVSDPDFRDIRVK